MTPDTDTAWCAWAEREAARFSRFSLSSLSGATGPAGSQAARSSRISLFSPGGGESGRIRENQIAILPHASDACENDLQRSRENRENSPQLHTCAGAARVNGNFSGTGDTSIPPDPPSGRRSTPADLLWTSLANKEDIYAIAYRLGLAPGDSTEAWRLSAIRVAKSEAFMRAKPSDESLRRADWERWRHLQESPRKMFDLLRKLIYGVRIWD